MKTVLVIPDGMGIRNFLCTSFIDNLLTEGEVVVWHALTDSALEPYRSRWLNSIRWKPLPSFREGLPERILRQAKIDAQLYWFYHEDNSEVIFRGRRPVRRLLSRMISGSAALLGRACGHRQGVIWLDRSHALATLYGPYLESFETLLRREKPDVVFCTHQRASRAVPAMVAARKLGVPTATFIYSWDNLPKGRMAVHSDHFLVWSNWMAQELLRYYPEISTNRVHPVGTPQFEHHSNYRLVKKREEFLSEIGLNSDRPVICFSGDDISTSPYDPLYLADLAQAVRLMPPAQRPQIIFRRCPVDASDRYRPVLTQYPEIAVSEPLWHHEGGDWTQAVPTMDDLALLVNIIHHCELVVNLGSTMAMDFAILDKPAIYINYNPGNLVGRWRINDIYRLPHFRTVHQLQPIYWANSPSELGTLVQRTLACPREKATERATWLNLHIQEPLADASRRCADELKRIGARY